jgi:hypothetical protein
MFEFDLDNLDKGTAPSLRQRLFPSLQLSLRGHNSLQKRHETYRIFVANRIFPCANLFYGFDGWMLARDARDAFVSVGPDPLILSDGDG